MSNGAQCCALEICCPDAAVRRSKLIQSLASATGADSGYCAKFLDWMDANDLTFAPKSFELTLQSLIAIMKAHPPQ